MQQKHSLKKEERKKKARRRRKIFWTIFSLQYVFGIFNNLVMKEKKDCKLKIVKLSLKPVKNTVINPMRLKYPPPVKKVFGFAKIPRVTPVGAGGVRTPGPPRPAPRLARSTCHIVCYQLIYFYLN